MGKIEDLQKIKKLLDEGLVTQKEFDKLKLDIIGKSDSNESNKNQTIIPIIKDNEKQCPSCKSIINKSLFKCPFCNYDFNQDNISSVIKQSVSSQPKVEFKPEEILEKKEQNKLNEDDGNSNKKLYIIFGVMLLFIAGIWFYSHNKNINNEEPLNGINTVSLPAKFSQDTSSTILSRTDANLPPADEKINDSIQSDDDSELNQMELNIKSGEKYTIADKNLNIVYIQVMAVLTENEKITLKQEQRNWIKLRDSNCSKEGEGFEGGTMYNQVINNCLIEKTNERIKELNEIFKSKE